MGSRATHNGDTVTSGIRAALGAVHRSLFFCAVAICYFVHIHNGVTSPARTDAFSRPVPFFLSLSPAEYFFPSFPFPRIPISGCHPSMSVSDALAQRGFIGPLIISHAETQRRRIKRDCDASVAYRADRVCDERLCEHNRDTCCLSQRDALLVEASRK